MSRACRVLALVVVAAALAACGGGGEQPEAAGCAGGSANCIRIGIGQPIFLGTLLSGDELAGVDALQSVRLAIDYLDGSFDGADGTLLSHQVVVLSEDDQCGSAGGRIGAHRLLAEADLVAVVGTTCSSAALGAAADVLAEHDVLLISPSNSAPALTDPATHVRTYFRTAANDLIQAAAVADFAADSKGWKTAVVVHTKDDAYSAQLATAFTEAFALNGGTNQLDLAFAEQSDASSLDDLDDAAGGGVGPAEVLRLIAARRPDVVFLPLQQDCDTVAKLLRKSPVLRDTAIIVGEACQTRAFLTSLGPLADGVFSSGPDFSDLEGSMFYREWYLPAYRRQAGVAPVSVYHPAAFDAANLIFDAIRRSAVVLPGGGLLIDREALRRALLDVDGYEGLSGMLSCGPSGDCAESARIAIYRAPGWPVNVGGRAQPVFSQSKTLAQVRGSG